MTTPAFVPQDSSTLTAIRYYTQFDPYYYSVDNRPLQDLEANITTISSGGGDSARRAVLLTQLGLSEVFRNLYTGSAAGYVTGLAVTTPGANTIRVNSGALYSMDVISSVLTDQVMKQALLLGYQDFTIAAPGTAGQSADYLIQIQHSSLTTANMTGSALPFLDSTNTFLPGLLLNGELKLSLKTGAAAATGSQVTPAPDSGWTPLYVVTATNGAGNHSVKYAANCPSYSKVDLTVSPVYPATNSATPTTVAGLPIPTFADASTLSVSIPVPIKNSKINPYAPIKVTVVYSTSVNTGNVQVQLSYLSLAVGGSTSAGLTSLTAETLPSPATANTIATTTLTQMIPPSAFSSFVSGAWTVSAHKLFLNLTRNGSAGADTMTGNLFIHDIIVSQ